MLKFYDLDNDATRLAFVNNMAHTVGNIIGIEEIRTTGGYGGISGSLGKSSGKNGFGISGGLDLSHSNRQQVNQINASLLHAINESEDVHGNVDYEKAETLLRNECDGLTKRGYKSGQIGLTSESHETHVAKDHFQHKFDEVINEIIPDPLKKDVPLKGT